MNCYNEYIHGNENSVLSQNLEKTNTYAGMAELADATDLDLSTKLRNCLCESWLIRGNS